MNLISFTQLGAQTATVIAIDASGKDIASRYKAAQIALQVAEGFKSLSTGDAGAGLAAAEAALLSKISDPGQATLVQAVFMAAQPFILAAAQGNAALPLVSATVAGAAAEIAAGIVAAASVYPAPAA